MPSEPPEEMLDRLQAVYDKAIASGKSQEEAEDAMVLASFKLYPDEFSAFYP